MGITYELIPLNNDEFSEAEETFSQELVMAIAEGNILPTSPFMKKNLLFPDKDTRLAFYNKFGQRKIEIIDDSTKAIIHVSPLHFAVIQGHSNLCTRLCEPSSVNATLEVFGSDTKTPVKIGGISYTHGFTALHIAAVHGRTHSEIKEYLLKQGANPDATDENGKTPEEVTPLVGKMRVVNQVLDVAGGAADNLLSRESVAPTVTLKATNASNHTLNINSYDIVEGEEKEKLLQGSEKSENENEEFVDAVDDTKEDAISNAQQFILTNNIKGLRDHLFALKSQSQVSELLLTAFTRKITNSSEKTLAECMEETFESGDSRMFYFIYDEFFQSKPLALLATLLQSKAYKLAEEVLLLHERNNKTVTVKDLLDKNNTLMAEFAKDTKAIALINKYKGGVVAQPATPLQKTLNALNAFRIQVSQNKNDRFGEIPFRNAHLATLMVNLRVFDKFLVMNEGDYPNDLIKRTHTLIHNVITQNTASGAILEQIQTYSTYVNNLKATFSPNGGAKWNVLHGILVILACAVMGGLIGFIFGGPPGAIIGAFEGLETGLATAGSMAITVGATATTAACIYTGYRMVTSSEANKTNRKACKDIASDLTEIDKVLKDNTRATL